MEHGLKGVSPLLLFLLLAGPTPAWAASRLALVEIRPVPPLGEEMGRRVEEALGRAVKASGGLEWVPVAVGAEELSMTANCSLLDEVCLGRLASILQVDYAIMGDVLRRGERLALSLRFVPVQAKEARVTLTLMAPLEALEELFTKALPLLMPPCPKGALAVVSLPGRLQAEVDGMPAGETPALLSYLAPGPHQVTLVGSPGLSHTLDGDVGPDICHILGLAAAGQGAVLETPVPPNYNVVDNGEKEGLVNQWWLWTIVGAGAAGVTAVVLGLALSAGQPDDTPEPPAIRVILR